MAVGHQIHRLNGIIAALYYSLTMLMILFPVVSQFGPLQCRLSEILVLFAFYRPRWTFGLTLGCLLANTTGALMGLGFPMDILFGTMAILIACLLEAYLSPRLIIAALWPVLINGVVVGFELQYFFLADTTTPLYITMLMVAASEAVAMAVGYIVIMLCMRNPAFYRAINPRKNADVKW